MSMFLLLKKSTYCNPPPFKVRLRRWYLHNVDSGRNAQIPWYQQVNFLIVLLLPVMSLLFALYGVPYFLS